MWNERQVRLMPQLPRDPALVDPRLWKLFGKLANGQAKWPLLLHGPPGTGKTCAAFCVCDRSRTAMYATTDALCDRVLRGDDPNLFEWIASKDLAVLDELGCREKVGDLHYTTVKQFADARREKPTIYITNLSINELRSIYDDRIVSRVLCGTWFELTGEDRRLAS